MQSSVHEMHTQMMKPVQLKIKNCDGCVYSHICEYHSHLHSDGCVVFTDTDIFIPTSNVDEMILYCENMLTQTAEHCYSVSVESYSQFIEKLKQLNN